MLKIRIARLAKLLEINRNNNFEFFNNSGNNETIKRSLSSQKSINKIISYLTPNVKIDFTSLRKIFIKAFIFCNLNFQSHIPIKMNIFGYAIGKILN